MAISLNSASLADIQNGNAHLLLIPRVSVLTTNCYNNAYEFFTTKDSLKLAEGKPTETDIQIDQNDGDILNTIVTKTKSQITGSLPYNAIDIFDLLYTNITGTGTAANGLATLTVNGTTYNQNKAYAFDKKLFACTMFMESQSKQTAISLMNVSLYGIINYENVTTKNWTIDFTGNILANGGLGDFVIHKQIATT